MFIIVDTLELKIFERFKEYFLLYFIRFEDDALFNILKIIRHRIERLTYITLFLKFN